MRRRLLIALVFVGLAQGLYAEYQVRQLWLDKVNLQSIIDDGNIKSVCHRIVERGL